MQHPDDIAPDEVAAAINQMLDVGLADARDTVEDPDMENPDAERATALTIGPPDAEAQRWAKVAWSIDDVQSLFDISDEDAADFLARHEPNLQERMIERGWDPLETLSSMDVLPTVDNDEELESLPGSGMTLFHRPTKRSGRASFTVTARSI